jgi:hypothetical protein
MTDQLPLMHCTITLSFVFYTPQRHEKKKDERESNLPQYPSRIQSFQAQIFEKKKKCVMWVKLQRSSSSLWWLLASFWDLGFSATASRRLTNALAAFATLLHLLLLRWPSPTLAFSHQAHLTQIHALILSFPPLTQAQAQAHLLCRQQQRWQGQLISRVR